MLFQLAGLQAKHNPSRGPMQHMGSAIRKGQLTMLLMALASAH